MAANGWRYLAFIGRTRLTWDILKAGVLVTGGAAVAQYFYKDKEDSFVTSPFSRVYAATSQDKKVKAEASPSEQISDVSESQQQKTSGKKPTVRTVRGKRMRKKFSEYASLAYEGQRVMTAEDFILALVEGPSRLKNQPSRQLTKDDVKGMLRAVPDLKKNSSKLFRTLGGNGLISFPEFVFLLCALTRSERGFKIGFMMLDEDGNESIDIAEFKRLTELIGHEYAAFGDDETTESPKTPVENSSVPNTALTVHLFGSSGRGKLSFDQFKTFVNNLWTEMIEVEFERVADPKTHDISIVDFGRIVLRYTHLDDVEQAAYLKRLRQKTKERISFEEFKQFNHFLTHLDDFRLSMRMYSIASVSVTQDELERAIFVASGVHFTPALLDVIYSVFDINEDQRLSYREFVSVLHDRLNRSLKSVASPDDNGKVTMWSQWKKCVKNEFRRTV